jgi:hypothetical protein
MGSGDRFRIRWSYDYWSLGISIVPRAEHRISVSINLIKIEIYMGFGKGYDE